MGRTNDQEREEDKVAMHENLRRWRQEAVHSSALNGEDETFPAGEERDLSFETTLAARSWAHGVSKTKTTTD
jgi:hypothetical protein